VDASGRLYVADKFYDRVLRVDAPAANAQAADLVLGEPDFTSGCRACGMVPQPTSARSLIIPIGVWTGRDGAVFVADSGASRVLRFSKVESNDQTADLVIGQPDFASDGGVCAPLEDGGFGPITARGLCIPQGGAIDRDGNVFVADSDNNRVLRFAPPLHNGQAASQVIGQPDFTHGSSDQAAGASTLRFPQSATTDFRGDLWVTDSGDARVLRYSAVEQGTPPVTPLN
jgi:sugar lactone lactonase YvrE